jgi:hypothetical protein
MRIRHSFAGELGDHLDAVSRQSGGMASSTQYFVMTGATLNSMNARTRFTGASS